MHRFTPMGWYQEDQRRRKEASDNFTTSNLNRRAQEFIRIMNGKINLVEVESEALHRINRELSQSSILYLQYANNFNSTKVLAAQLEFMLYLKEKYPELDNGRIEVFVNQATYQVGHELVRHREYWKRILN